MEATVPPASPVDLRDRPFWHRTWLVVGVLVLTLFVAFVVWKGGTTIYYVVMAWFIALAMEPAVAKLATRMKRGLATGVVMLVAGLAMAGFVAAFGTLFVNQLVAFAKAVPSMASDALDWINRSTGSTLTFDNLLEQVGVSTSDLAGYAQDIAFYLLGIVVGLLSSAFGIFILVFFVFYISAGMPRLRGWLARRMRPDLQVPFLAAWDLTKIKVGGYIAARIVLASINSACSAVAFVLIGLPYWLPLALWTGLVAQFVPNIGTYISIALPVLVGLTSGNWLLGVYVLIYAVAYQQVENLTIEPRISARAVDLHPAVSFGAALLGAQLFGLSGALLGVPVAATAMAMVEIYKRRYELTATTEDRVAALVAPRSDGSDEGPPDPVSGGDRDRSDDRGSGDDRGVGEMSSPIASAPTRAVAGASAGEDGDRS
jgi:predicted PurR-regulated permease PerM